MDRRIVRSPLFYVGDKFKLLPEILEHFPKQIDKFVEPFTGGGSVFLNVIAKEYYLNDIDTNIRDIHKVLIQYSGSPDKFFEKVASIIKKYGLSKSYVEDIVPPAYRKEWKKTYYAHFNRAAYEKLKRDYNSMKPTKRDPILLYLLLIYGFNRMTRFNSRNQFNIPVGNVDFNKNVENSLKSYLDRVRNKEIIWSVVDFKPFLRSISLSKKDLVYLDPPYLITASEYNKFWNEQREKALINSMDALDKAGVRFAVSNVVEYRGKENLLFEKWMSDYNVFNVRSNYISYHDNQSKKIREVLVTNY